MRKQANIFFDLSTLAGLGHDAIVGKTVRVRKPERVRIGDGSIIDDFTYISCAVEVGRYTHIGPNCTLIGGDARIVIGDCVNVAPGCRLIASSNDYSGGGLVGAAIPRDFADPSIVEEIVLNNHVLLGAGTVVLPGTHVPEGLCTGAMTLLTPRLHLEPWTLYVGVPAHPLRKRDSARILEGAARLLKS